MRNARVVTAALLSLVVAGTAAYAVADARDLVPGVLTLPEPVPSGLAQVPSAQPAIATATPAAPTAEGVAAALTPLLADASLGSGAGAVVRDAASGTVLLAVDADRPRTIASAQKVLSALAITEHLDMDGRMQTVAVAGGPGEVVLVAGGDTLLATGAGDPTAVVGRAGLADLARQVAAAAAAGPLTVRLDTTHAAGPRVPGVWNPADVAMGFTRTVGQIGLAQNRPVLGIVPRQESDADVLAAFAAALIDTGREVTVSPAGASAGSPPPAGARRLGVVESAPRGDVLAYGMAESDNAILESLARQAMAAAGVPIPADGNTGGFVTEALLAAGIPRDGLHLTDASGLAPGQTAPLTAVDQVLAKGLDGTHSGLQRVIADLPVSGLTGTLASRFTKPDTADVAGIPRAKTGTLTGTAALAGVTTDADGRLLSFVISSDKVPRSYEGTITARLALDRFAAALTRCGCR